MVTRPFRFGVQLSGAPSGAAWRELVAKVEDLGYSTVFVPDHLEDQWAPMVALTAAAEATTHLKVGPLVLDNDFRHPVVLAKEAATLDLLSDGRLELGLGAGWMISDYVQSGIPMDSAGVRIDRLAESIEILDSLWTTGTSTFAGVHYTTEGAVCEPRRAESPALMIGGGGKRILSLAARHAAIVSIVPSLASGAIGKEVVASAVESLYDERIGWVKDAAGDRFAEIELQCWTALCQVVPNAAEVIGGIAELFDVTPAEITASPTALIGTVDQLIDLIGFRRERFGFSYIVVHEPEFEAFAPVVAALAGT